MGRPSASYTTLITSSLSIGGAMTEQRRFADAGAALEQHRAGFGRDDTCVKRGEIVLLQ